MQQQAKKNSQALPEVKEEKKQPSDEQSDTQPLQTIGPNKKPKPYIHIDDDNGELPMEVLTQQLFTPTCPPALNPATTMRFRPLQFSQGGSISRSFLLSPQNNIATRPSVQGISDNTSSFDVNCFSFADEGSGYYAFIGPDGHPSNFVKIGNQQYQIVSPKTQDISSLLRQGSKIMLLENSADQFENIDEESVQDDSIEEIKLFEDNQQTPKIIGKTGKKAKQTRNHILIFKNPMEMLGQELQDCADDIN